MLADLAAVARAHPGRPLVLLCLENVHAGQSCHRRWLADWLADRYGLEVLEVEEPGRLPLG